MENHNYMLIADDAGEFRDTCKAALEAKGFEVEVCRKDGRALLDMIREKKPTAVLMEALMSGLDGLGVLMAVSRGECGVQPTIFTMTGMDAPGITNQLIRAGSAYHFVKPFDPDIIAERVEMMCAPAAGEEAVAAARPAVEVVDLETIVTEIIMEIGIPAHIKGYQYIRDGIIMTVGNRRSSTALPRCFIRPSPKRTVPLPPVWSVPSAMPSRWPGTAGMWIFSIPISAIPSTICAASPPTVSSLP